MSHGLTSAFLTLLLAVTLAMTAGATPVVQIRDSLVRLPMARQVNSTGSTNILAQDQARVRLLRARAEAHLFGTPLPAHAAPGVPLSNQLVSYIATVDIGHPPAHYSLIVDTGSSNTWVGAGRTYTPTSTSKKTNDTVEVTYGSGFFAGDEYLDTMSLGKGLTITKQSIGVASRAEGFAGVDGILGIGPVDLTVGTLYPSNKTAVPTVTDNLFKQHKISCNAVAVSFEPTDSLTNVNGELTFGGTDPKKFTGKIHYAPITHTQPSSSFWGIDQSITYGSTSIMSKTAGIVDTGTTLILLADDAWEKYLEATGAERDYYVGLLRITPAQYANLQSLFFTINGVTYELTPDAQIWPRALNAVIGGDPKQVYLIVAPIGLPSGQGLDFVNGMTFLERFYSVYDTANKRVGLATTRFTHATTNWGTSP